MPAEVPAIQILSRQNYQDQYIVRLPNAFPLPALGSSSLRIKSSILSLTTNNLTYARIGHLVGWWDIHPLPPSIPDEFSNPKDYGRISAWGYGIVIESTISNIGVGTQVYGYLPIGTLPVDMKIRVDDNVPGIFWETSEHRKNIMPIYNRYTFYPPETAPDKENRGLDALIQTLFKCGFLINRFLFPWDRNELIQPSGGPDDGWTFEKAKVGDDTTLLLFAASGKTGLATAYCLKNCRPEGNRALQIIAVGSRQSLEFAKGTNLFDKVLTYDAGEGDIARKLGLNSKSKIIICNFGARDSADDRWATKLRNDGLEVITLRIGGEVIADSPEKASERFFKSRKSSGGLKASLNASGVTFKAIDMVGEKRFADEYMSAWKDAKEDGFCKGLKLIWGEGMDQLGKGWERLCKGEVRPDEGLVFDLDGDTVSITDQKSTAHHL